MFLKHHEFEARIDEAVDGAKSTGDALDPDLKKEILFAASRGPEALEGLLACLDARQRHAAFAMLQSEEGNRATARALGRVSDEEANYNARRAALDATPVRQPKEVAAEVTERAQASVREEAQAPAPAKEDAEAASAANAVWMASMQERAGETGQAVKDEQDNLAAREAHFAKKWEGNELLARALARRRGGS